MSESKAPKRMPPEVAKARAEKKAAREKDQNAFGDALSKMRPVKSVNVVRYARHTRGGKWGGMKWHRVGLAPSRASCGRYDDDSKEKKKDWVGPESETPAYILRKLCQRCNKPSNTGDVAGGNHDDS